MLNSMYFKLNLFSSNSAQARCTRYNIMWSSLSVAGRWFSLGTPVSSTNETDSHNITEILFKVAINIIGQALFELHFLYKKAELTFWREYFVTIFTLKTFAFPSLWLSNSLINMTFDLIIFIISLVSVVSI